MLLVPMINETNIVEILGGVGGAVALIVIAIVIYCVVKRRDSKG